MTNRLISEKNIECECLESSKSFFGKINSMLPRDFTEIIFLNPTSEGQRPIIRVTLCHYVVPQDGTTFST